MNDRINKSAKLGMLPTSPDPHVGVLEVDDYRGDLHERCEVLVIGSGPGGAVIAKELAEAGRDVIVLEAGPPMGKQDFVQEAGSAMQRMLREGGSRAARGNIVTPTMQAACLGGGSVINSAICARPPDWIFDKWAERTGCQKMSRSLLDPHFDRVEEQLCVAPTPERVQGERNRLFRVGCEKLGMSVDSIWRNVRGCKGSGECFTGCRNGAKKSVDITYIPAAVRAGARVYTGIRAEKLIHSGKKVSGAHCRIVEPFTRKALGKARFDADIVVLAAGCMATPLILMNSKLANSSGYVGKDLRFHPGLAVMGMFEQEVDPWEGATQGYHSLHYLREGLKFEVLWSPPAVLATRMPGLGTDYQHHLLRYKHLAPFDVICAADESSGTVKPRVGNPLAPDIQFHFHQNDVDLMRKGLGILSDICWAAGAQSILPGLNGIPEVIRNKEEAEIIRNYPLNANDTIAASNHAFCTTRMSSDPTRGVVNESGRCHDLDNLYIADTSIFAASSGVNPMLLCMALSDYIASEIATR